MKDINLKDLNNVVNELNNAIVPPVGDTKKLIAIGEWVSDKVFNVQTVKIVTTEDKIMYVPVLEFERYSGKSITEVEFDGYSWDKGVDE